MLICVIVQIQFINKNFEKDQLMTIIDYTTKDYSLIRYMDLSKFLDLLDSETLFFCRADQLSKDDPYEGDYTIADYEAIVKPILESMEQTNDPSFQYWYVKNNLREDESLIRKPILYSVGVSCWHIAECQSVAMWKIYSSNTGIAIKTNLSKLKAALDIADKDRIYEIGEVTYLDYARDKILQDPKQIYSIICKIKAAKTDQEFYDIINNSFPFFVPLLVHKRNAFDYEHELRILTRLIYDQNVGENIQNKFGDKCSIDLNLFIDEIYVSPYAPDWLVPRLRNIVNNRYGLNKFVCKSDLNVNLIC